MRANVASQASDGGHDGPEATIDGKLGDAASRTADVEAGPRSDGALDAGCSSILTCEPSVTSFASCWTCVKQACSLQLTSCAADSTCSSAIAAAIDCVEEGGETGHCFDFAFTSASDPVLSNVQPCFHMAYGQCGCATSSNPGMTPSVEAGADLPLCGCTTVPPHNSANCVQTPSCHIPTCNVGGSPCCTPAGLCGCASAVPGGPDLTCN